MTTAGVHVLGEVEWQLLASDGRRWCRALHPSSGAHTGWRELEPDTHLLRTHEELLAELRLRVAGVVPI